jgi:hypothetical protein
LEISLNFRKSKYAYYEGKRIERGSLKEKHLRKRRLIREIDDLHS